MKNNKKDISFDEDITLDDYDMLLLDLDKDIDLDEEVKKDKEEVDYTEFNKINDYDDFDDVLLEDDYDTTNSAKTSLFNFSEGTIRLLATISNVVRIVGIILMIIVIAYYLSVGDIRSLFIYIIMLVFAYFFGYGFMYVLTKLDK